MTQVEDIAYEGWEHCVRIDNGLVELVVTTDVGPRIVDFRRSAGENVFFLDEAATGTTGGEDWELYGGHRLWHAPESDPRTYQPDNELVEVERTDRGCRLVQPVEGETGIRKAIEIEMPDGEPAVEIGHELTNEGVWSVELAPWAISVCKPGGTAVVPFPDGDPDELLPDRSLVFWPRTDVSDERIRYVDDHVLVEQADGPEFKIGANALDGWAAYVNDGRAFVKTFEYDPEATYPDRGASVEVYMLDHMLELETLGPLVELAPGETTSHTERWHLFEDVSEPETGADAASIVPE
ncbi:DUF4380 family [Halapricum desulfuricans]|uniref:DUF4380 family n=1 Tax=Halapricum desulfuricans TaxID=2841257 RepID=A0A897NPH6_9EURY|nr:DUF4380 domain-containing protein [Halapricum desulfuricans]QSG12773.1 DUF4380 family [Halapricum desulfuricans]